MGSDTQAKFSHTTYISLDDPINPTGVYGQVSPISTSSIELPGVYGQVSSIGTSYVELPGVYGQVSAISGIQYSVVTSNIAGLGDIIYYGDAGDIYLDSYQMLGAINDPILASGLVLPSSDYSSILSSSSMSIVFSENAATGILPDSDIDGVYLHFSNHNGLDFAVSGVNDIVTSIGISNLVSISGPGSHLGLVGAGAKWVAIEESGIV
jgi:hypothetical protein